MKGQWLRKEKIEIAHEIDEFSHSSFDVIVNRDPLAAIDYDENSAAQSARAYYEQGNRYRDNGLYEEALACYKDAIIIAEKEGERHSSYYYQRADMHYRLNQIKEAIACYQKAIEINPSKAAYFYNLANAQHRLSQQENQTNEQREQLCHDSIFNHTQAIALVQPQKKSFFQHVADFFTSTEEAYQAKHALDRYLYRRGLVYVSLKDYKNALADFIQASHINPHKIRYQLLCGNMYYELKDYLKAQKIWNRLLKSDSEFTSIIYSNLAFYDHHRKQFKKALQNCRKATQYLKANDQITLAIILINQGLIYSQLREYQIALEYYEKAEVNFKDPNCKQPTLNDGWIEGGLQLMRDYSSHLASAQQALHKEIAQQIFGWRNPLHAFDNQKEEQYANDDPHAIFPMIRVSELEFKKRLGEGKFGTVIHAKWRHQDVAVKKLKLDEFEEFKKEATIMAKLRHNHTIPLHGVCIENDNYCLVMKYMPKGSLSKRLNYDFFSMSCIGKPSLDALKNLNLIDKIPLLIKNEDNEVWIYGLSFEGTLHLTLLDQALIRAKLDELPFSHSIQKLERSKISLEILDEIISKQGHVPLSKQEVYILALDIAQGIYYLHSEGIRHRDLKSDNVLLCDEDNRLLAKVCDYGLAIAKNESSDNKGRVGTKEWMAPEVDRGGKDYRYTTSADVYSYGMVLKELITQKVLISSHQEYILDVQQILIELSDQCCNVEPDERPTMEDIVQRLIVNQVAIESRISEVMANPETPVIFETPVIAALLQHGLVGTFDSNQQAGPFRNDGEREQALLDFQEVERAQFQPRRSQ